MTLLVSDGVNVRDPLTLKTAIKRQYAKLVTILLDAGADANSKDSNCTAPQTAAKAGHVEILSLLISAGGDVNAPVGEYVMTALQAAAAGGHEKLANLLISAGADVNAPPSAVA